MTSLAPKIFSYAITYSMGIYFIGSKQSEIDEFIRNVKIHYPSLNIIGYRNGYFNTSWEKNEAINVIINSDSNIVVIGMGCPLQDEFSTELHKKGFEGTSYTCGGFIHQFKDGLMYYPKYIDRLNMRLAYRIINEKHVFKRTMVNLFRFIKLLLKEYSKLRNRFKNEM